MKSSHSGILSPLQFPATRSPQFPVAFTLLLIIVGSKENRSGGGDVEDEAVAEFDDSFGTTNGPKFPALQRV